jgi:hypothetical protein
MDATRILRITSWCICHTDLQAWIRLTALWGRAPACWFLELGSAVGITGSRRNSSLAEGSRWCPAGIGLVGGVQEQGGLDEGCPTVDCGCGRLGWRDPEDVEVSCGHLRRDWEVALVIMLIGERERERVPKPDSGSSSASRKGKSAAVTGRETTNRERHRVGGLGDRSFWAGGIWAGACLWNVPNIQTSMNYTSHLFRTTMNHYDPLDAWKWMAIIYLRVP